MTAREREEGKKEKRHNPYVTDFDITPRLTEEQKKELLKSSFQRTAADFVPVDRNGRRKTAQDGASIEGLKQMRMNGLEGAGQDKIYTFFGLHGFIGWQLCAVIAQHWAVNNACSIPAEDAARPGWENSLAGGENEAAETQEQSADIPARLKELSLQKYGLVQALIRHAKNMKIFGVSYLLPVFDRDYDYSKPYNPDGIQPGSFKGFKIIDPYWVMPQWRHESMSNPASIHFYEPEFYCLPGGKNVHYTQILKAVNAEVPDILKPSYYFGGIPLTQMIYERVYAAEKVANEAPLMALTKRTSVLYTNLEEILAQPEIAAKNLTTIAKYRDNQGIMLQDQDSRYEQHDVSLADFDQLISMQYQLVAAVAKIPAEKLFKTPISGLGQTGAYAEHDYKQELQSLQERVYMPVVNRANEIIMRSDLERTEPITAAFNPVDMPTEKEKAEIQEIKARINTGYLTSGVITPEEARDALRNDKDSVYAGLTDEVPENYGGENLSDNGNENEAQPPSGNSGGKEEEPIGKDQQIIFNHGQFHKYKISEEELKKYNRPVPAHNGNTDNNTAEDRKPFNESDVKRDRKGQFAEQNEKGAEKSEEPQEQEQQENLSGGFYGKKPKDKRGSKHSKGTAGKKHYYGISDMTAAEAEAKLKSYAPETVAGIKRGKPMTFNEADHGRGNPNYKLGGGHTSNCQASVLAHILRLRGYDVSALPFSKKNPAFKELASDPRKGFVIDDKGTHPDYIKHKKLKNMPEVISFLNDTIPIGTIYCFEKHDTYFGDGHICLIDKSNNGNLRIHDPQTGVTVFEEGFKKYFGKIIFEGINIFRADNAGVNSEIADKVLRSNKK